MPDEYVKRSDVIAAILGDPPDAHYPSWYADMIKELPADDDVVKVVRCRECKWWRDSTCENVNGPYKTFILNPFWFCRSGERKEDT